MKPEKLYVCLGEGSKLSLHTRTEVDLVIKTIEEDYDGSMPFTVVGNILVPVEGSPFFVTYKVGNTILYDIVIGTEENKAKETLLNKKRLKGKNVTILAFRNISQLITDYYE